MSVTLSNLDGIIRLQPGVGSVAENDLRIRLREDLQGRWFPVIQRGVYYIGIEEHYLYGSKGTSTFTPTTSGIGTTTVTSLDTDPTSGGPVRVVRSADGLYLQRVVSPLRAFRALQVSGSGELKSAASSGLLISLCTDPLSGVYLQVPASGDIISTDEYTYNVRTSTIQLRDTSPPSLWATYLVDETDTDALRQEEIVVVDSDGMVRTQYTNVCGVASLAPIIRKPYRSGVIQVTGTVVSGNVISLPASGITSGNLVAVQYYVWNSFTSRFSDGTLTTRYLVQTSGGHTVEYEAGTTDVYDLSLLASTHPDYLQLNPLFSPRSPGFLFLADADDAWPEPRSVRLALDDTNAVFRGAGGQKRRLVATVYDGERNVLSGVTVTTSASGTASGTLTALSGTTTNAQGQVAYTWNPTSSGETTLTATVNSSGDIYQDALQLHVWELTTYTNANDFYLGKALAHLEPSPYLPGTSLHRITVYYGYPDGAPYQPAGEHDALSFTVTLTSIKGIFHTLTGQPLHNLVTLLTGEDSSVSVLIEPVPGDVIRARVETLDAAGVSRQRHARPIRVVEGAANG